MAARSSLASLIVFLTLTATLTPLFQIHAASSEPSALQTAAFTPTDPSIRNIAFNVTLAQFDLYTNRTSGLDPDPVASPGILTWFNSTIDGRQVNGTRFLFEIPAGAYPGQNVTWAVLIPMANYTGSATNPTILRFRWNGTVTTGTSARYMVLNGTDVEKTVVHNQNFTSGQSPASLPCFPNEECFDVSPFIGKTVNLVFKFNSTASGTGLKVEVSHVTIASVSRQLTNPQTDIHTMNVGGNPSQIIHTANSTIVPFNTTAAQPSGVHVWNSTAIIFRLPLAYTLTGISINGTTPLDLGQALDDGNCTPTCNNRLPVGNTTIPGTRFISFNATSVFAAITRNTPAVIDASSSNAVTTLEPALAGVSTDSWVPGDLIGVRMRVQLSLNVSGTHNVTIADPTGGTPAGLRETFTNKGGTYVYNFTLPATATLGVWNVQGEFLGGYDFGFMTHSFRVDQISAEPPQMTGGVGQGRTLTVQGRLTYSSDSTPARNTNVTAFAVDAGSPPSGGLVSTGGPSSGLYISNITIVNGVFTQGQALIVYFTVTNPAPSTAFAANVTIEHEWYDGFGGNHGVATTFPLELGDQPFLGLASFYRMDISLTDSGLRLSVSSVRTNQKVTVTPTPGTTGVSSSRQHFGLFKIAVTSAQISAGTPSTSLPLRSPTYAYVLDTSLIPSRLLGFSPTVETLPDGSFSATINATRLLGAKRLVVFMLARDANGTVIGRSQVETASDSTTLIPTVQVPGEVTTKQAATVTLTLKNNSTALPMTLTVSLIISGSGTVVTNNVVIQNATTTSTTFPFTAPDAAGSYLLTFSSPQFGVLLTDTLNVVLLPSSLQTLIPAIIGLLAALVILGIYLIRRRPEVEVEKEEKKRSASGKPSKPAQGQSSRNP